MKSFILFATVYLVSQLDATSLPPSKKPAAPGVTSGVGKVELLYNPKSGKNAKIVAAITRVNELFDPAKGKRQDFMNAVLGVEQFTYTQERSDSIAKWVFGTNMKLTIRGYNGGTRTKTLAYVGKKYPNVVNINIDKAKSRSSANIAATIVHELVHSVDRKISPARFGHGDNTSKGKKKSAPYAIGRIAQLVSLGEISRAQNTSPQQLLALVNAIPEEEMAAIYEPDYRNDSQPQL